MVDDDGPGPPAALPMGFPGCRRCWWRAGADPQVCLACYQAGAEGRGDAGCPVCGQPLRSGERCPNRWCGRADRAFSAAFSVGTYQGDLRRAVVAYKYGGERWWANAFANLLAAYLDSHATWFEEFDLIVAMPAYLGPGARRGWDPVGLVVAALGRLAQGRWEVNPGLVQKLAETPAMSGRTWWERERDGQGALRRALRVTDPRAVQGAAILVVDDVFTGGSSLHEVARALQGAGAAEVAGLVLARPAWRGPARPDPPGLARCGNPKPGRVAQDGDLAGTAIPRGCRRSVARVSEAVRVSVAEVRAAIPSGLGVEAGLVVLQEDLPPFRRLHIVIGQPEARAIHAATHGVVPARPGTWDLFVSAIAILDGSIERVLITAVEQERHFYAVLDLDHDGQRRRISCRPSDAIALAVRQGEVRIFAAPEVLAAAGRLADGTRAPAPEAPAPDAPAPDAPAPEAPAPDAPSPETPSSPPDQGGFTS